MTCSSAPQQPKPLATNEEDLGIGLSPTPPLNEPILGEKSRMLLMNAQKTKIRPLLANSNEPPLAKNASNALSIMSSSGGLLTLWALNPGNWVWGYTPIDSHGFGKAPFWRIISFANGQVMIKNEEKSTCLQAYKNGVIHQICDEKNSSQFWNLNFFDNQAIQIQNVGTKTCLQTPTIRTTTYYSIYLTNCASNKPNLDQQWYITPILDLASPIFVID